MNIWIVNHYALAPTQGGGTRHHVLARRLIASGHDVTIIASNVDYISRAEMPLPSEGDSRLAEEEGVPFLRVRTPAYRDNGVGRIWNMLHFARAVMRRSTTAALPRPDVIIGSSPHPFAAVAAARLASRHQVPFVLEVRDLWPQSLVDVGRIGAGHPLIRMLAAVERWLYRRADRIITLLPRAADHIVEKGGDARKVMWLPNGVDLSLSKLESRPAQADRFTVMYAGAHGQANALHLVLDAAAELQRQGLSDRVLFRLIGDGARKPALQERAERESLRNVRFEPLVPKARVFEVLAEADAFVIPIPGLELYRYGVSPNKLFDYLASARPTILASTLPDTPVTMADAGLTVAPSGEAIADAVRSLIALSPDERRAMGQRGRAYVEANFDMTVLAGRLERELRSVVGEQNSAA